MRVQQQGRLARQRVLSVQANEERVAARFSETVVWMAAGSGYYDKGFDEQPRN
jgi:hypothetical protein